ncbi:ABC transporter ATP-binding protein [Mycobacterium sp. MYCO198283]|uniref:metal ABC transporter ATP-binding protein n=1 Tax=Mycobacterium sp. MYCO198283 TaxID=2883505 RepID=UPI001E5B34BE|nr:ABC transporter ATP-binding protein [Mycobacterium sp. MYCO198283]MCG5431420.1 ABC transporter ATP-binding protein [Mycobacterium sp. MYCO198283]
MPPPEAAALQFDGVSAVRGGRLVWSEGTFEVPAGGIVAVIGSNGSGKTTLLQVVLGLVPPASGRVRVFGAPPGAANDAIGYVPQNYVAGAGDAIRARDAVTLGITGRRWGLARTSAEDRRRVDEALAAVNATDFADARLSQLSGGQRQRIAIAHALVARPRMLILDEPLASLDLRSQHELVALLARLNGELGMTILVVAHDLAPLLGVLTSAIYLLDGHAHHAPIGTVVDADLLTHLYGSDVDVAHTLQGQLYKRTTP